MSDELETEMRATYSASKRWWRGVLLMWFASTALAIVTQAPIPEPLPTIATALSFLLTATTFASRWRADVLYQTAEALRRVLLLADGLGEASNPADLARLRAGASGTVSGDPNPIGAYYTSEHDTGWHRVLHNAQESAFYTEALAQRTAWMCALGVVATLIMAMIALFLAVNMPRDAAVSRIMGNATMVAVASVVGGTLADLARSYFALSRAAATCFDRAGPLLGLPVIPLRAALRAVDAYDAGLASAPPIPGLVYRSMQARLDLLWKQARSPIGSSLVAP